MALRHLIIGEVEVRPFSDTNAVFPHLVELSILGARVDQGALVHLSSVRTMPRLKTFAITCVGTVELRSPWTVLDVLEVENIDIHKLDAGTVLHATLRVIDQSLTSPRTDLSTLPSCLRLYFQSADLDFNDASLEDATHNLRKLVRRLSDLPPSPSSTSLRYLSLPLPLRRQPSLKFIFERITALCAEKGVEVIWDPALDWACQSAVSPGL